MGGRWRNRVTFRDPERREVVLRTLSWWWYLMTLAAITAGSAYLPWPHDIIGFCGGIIVAAFWVRRRVA